MGAAMPEQISIHYFQTEDEEWLCAVQAPEVHGGAAMKGRLSALADASQTAIPEEGEEHLAVLARIAIHHAMEQLGEPQREFKLEFLPPVVKIDAPASGMGASILNLFEGVTVWRQAD
jgi:hypothetical protein